MGARHKAVRKAVYWELVKLMEEWRGQIKTNDEVFMEMENRLGRPLTTGEKRGISKMIKHRWAWQVKKKWKSKPKGELKIFYL